MMLDTTQPKTILTIPSDKDIVMTRTFETTPERLFEVWTKEEHVRTWWAVRGTTMTVCEIDLRVGGTWRWVVARPPKMVAGFSGVYLEIDPPNGFKRTERYEEGPDGECIVDVRFEKQGTQTVQTMKMSFATTADRDACLKSGMELGVEEAMNNIAAILAGMDE